MKGDNISAREAKKIVHDIIDTIKKETGIRINAFPITRTEFLKKRTKEKFSLQQSLHIAFIKLYPRAGGFNDLQGNTYYFIERLCQSDKIEKNIFNLANASFHEARHSMQQRFNPYSYLAFLGKVENHLRNIIKGDYLINHDVYSYEIDANLYGVKRASNYLRAKYPEYYEKQKDYIRRIYDKYMLNYYAYDPVAIIDLAINYANTISVSYNIKMPPKLTQISPVFKVFFDEHNKFRPVRDIINDVNFHKVDDRIVYAMFSTKAFLNQVDMNKLNERELKIIDICLKKTKDMYKNQLQKALPLIDKDRKMGEIAYSKMSTLDYIANYGNKTLKLLYNGVVRKNSESPDDLEERYHHKINETNKYLEKVEKVKTRKRIINKTGGYIFASSLFTIIIIIVTIYVTYILMR